MEKCVCVCVNNWTDLWMIFWFSAIDINIQIFSMIVRVCVLCQYSWWAQCAGSPTHHSFYLVDFMGIYCSRCRINRTIPFLIFLAIYYFSLFPYASWISLAICFKLSKLTTIIIIHHCFNRTNIRSTIDFQHLIASKIRFNYDLVKQQHYRYSVVLNISKPIGNIEQC